MATLDVTVMGAGIFGLSCAYSCARRGARVRVIDPHGIGAGSSGGIVGALAPHTPENWNDKKEFQFQSLLMAQAFWDGVDALSGQSSGYGRLGRLQSVADERARAACVGCFRSLDDAGRAKELRAMGQRELQETFRTAFNRTTTSNNNQWLRRRIVGCMGIEAGAVNLGAGGPGRLSTGWPNL